MTVNWIAAGRVRDLKDAGGGLTTPSANLHPAEQDLPSHGTHGVEKEREAVQQTSGGAALRQKSGEWDWLRIEMPGEILLV